MRTTSWVHLSPDFRAVECTSILIPCPGIQGCSRTSRGDQRGSLAAASPRDHPAQVQCTTKAPESAWKKKNLSFSSHMNYGKKLFKIRFHYTHPRASSCVRLTLLKNTLGSHYPTWHLCFCILFGTLLSLLTSPSVAVLAALGQAGPPRGPQGHGALGRARQVTHLGGGRGRALAKLPIHWSGN